MAVGCFRKLHSFDCFLVCLPPSTPAFPLFFFNLWRTRNQMSVADLIIALRVKGLKDGVLDGVPTTIVDTYPNLIALYENIVGEPKIAAFIAKHAK